MQKQGWYLPAIGSEFKACHLHNAQAAGASMQMSVLGKRGQWGGAKYELSQGLSRRGDGEEGGQDVWRETGSEGDQESSSVAKSDPKIFSFITCQMPRKSRQRI